MIALGTPEPSSSSTAMSRVPASGPLPSCPGPSGRGAGWKGTSYCNYIHCSETSITFSTLWHKLVSRVHKLTDSDSAVQQNTG